MPSSQLILIKHLVFCLKDDIALSKAPAFQAASSAALAAISSAVSSTFIPFTSLCGIFFTPIIVIYISSYKIPNICIVPSVIFADKFILKIKAFKAVVELK
jgi:hypothetical protein